MSDKSITKQDIVDLFINTCPDIQWTEEEIKCVGEDLFGKDASYDLVRGFLLHETFIKVIDELYNKSI